MSSRVQITVLASVAAAVVQLDGSALNVALPTLGQIFGAPLGVLQWIVDAYTLTYACLLLSAGSASDRFGAPRLFTWGLGAFALASACCALSPRAEILILGRMLQGAAGSILIPSSLALVHQSFGDDNVGRTRAIGWWTAGGGAAITIGPIVGSLCVAYLGWRSIFLLNIPICIAGMVSASRLPTRSPQPDVPLGRSRSGQILAAVSMFGLVGGIIEAGSKGFDSGVAISGLAVFAAAGAAFAHRERLAPSPILPAILFRSGPGLSSLISGFVLSFCAFGLVFALSVYYQLVQKLSIVEAGLAFVPFALTITAANVIGGSLAAKVGAVRTMVGALTIAVIGYALLMWMEPSSSYLAMLPAQIIARLGTGAAVPLTTSILLSATPKAQSGIASAGLNAVRQAGAAIGVAIFGALMTANPVHGFKIVAGFSAVMLLATAVGVGILQLGRPGRLIAPPKGKFMPEATALRDLFDRWEWVWHEGRFDLVPDCVAPLYIRHDEAGDRTVTREAYAAELAQLRQQRPDVRILVYDHSFDGERAWYRFTMRWTDQASGEVRTRAGLQAYRTEGGKLAETWVIFQPLGSAWVDPVAQTNWTTPVQKS